MKNYLKIFALILIASNLSFAEQNLSQPHNENNILDELDPRDPNINSKLEMMDRWYEEQTGKSAFPLPIDLFSLNRCFRDTCAVWAQVVRSTQLIYLYVNGILDGTYKVSTGKRGYKTPNFDRHPNGRIYDRYNSRAFPGGDYKGLGNMPYAVFIQGGYAIHGTTEDNFPRLGTPASHGCIRMHPEKAYIFNRLVRAQGIHNVWITVQE